MAVSRLLWAMQPAATAQTTSPLLRAAALARTTHGASAVAKRCSACHSSSTGRGVRGRGQHRQRGPDVGRQRDGGGGAGSVDGDEPDALYGFHAVASALRAGRRRIHRLLIDARAFEASAGSSKRHARACSDAAIAAGIPVIHVKTPVLDSMSRSRPHQGVVLECDPLPLLLQPDSEHFSGGPPDAWPPSENGDGGVRRVWVLLERIHDAHNLGALLRTSMFFGAERVLLHDCARPTPAVARASTGATEWVRTHVVTDVGALAADARASGWRVVGTDAVPSDRDRRGGGSGAGTSSSSSSTTTTTTTTSSSSSDASTSSSSRGGGGGGDIPGQHPHEGSGSNGTSGGVRCVPLHEADVGDRVIVCFGNEGHGLRPQTLGACDVAVGIPRRGPSPVDAAGASGRRAPRALYDLDSLNVSVSCGVVLAALTSGRCGA